jgi:hypothetical protein
MPRHSEADAYEYITPYNIVGIFSKVLNTSQRRYPAYKKELYAIVASLRRFHTYIWGRNDLVIVTDHKPLTFIFSSTQLSPSLQQWLDVILDYTFTIVHRDGILHVLPDRLSRLFTDVYTSSTWGAGANISAVAGVDANIVSASLPEVKTSDPITVSTLATSSVAPIVDNTATASLDAAACRGIDSVSSVDAGSDTASSSVGEGTVATVNNRSSTYTTEEIDLFIELERRGKKVVHDLAERKQLITNIHLHGHFGVSAMFNKLWHQGYWWPRIRDDIQAVLVDCDACIRYNVGKSGFHPFTPITALGPGDHYMIDLSTHLPPSNNGFNTLLALIDVYTGFVVLRAMRSSTAEVVARKLWKIFCLIGWPRILQSDNGPEFVNQVLRALMKLIGVDHRLISPYNPRADGKVERVIGSTMMIIKKLLHGAKQNWSLYVPFAQVTFNDKISALTGSSPFALMFGRTLNELRDYNLGISRHDSSDAAASRGIDSASTSDSAPVEYTPIPLDDWKTHQEKILSVIYPAIDHRIKGAKDKLAQTLTKHRRMLMPASVPNGATVMIKDPVRGNKFEPKYIGPFIIVRRARNGAYVLKDTTGDILDRHVPIDQMKIVSKRGRDKDKDTFVVNKILKHDGAPGSYTYLVNWKGYDDSYDLWVPESDFTTPTVSLSTGSR